MKSKPSKSTLLYEQFEDAKTKKKEERAAEKKAIKDTKKALAQIPLYTLPFDGAVLRDASAKYHHTTRLSGRERPAAELSDKMAGVTSSCVTQYAAGVHGETQDTNEEWESEHGDFDSETLVKK